MLIRVLIGIVVVALLASLERVYGLGSVQSANRAVATGVPQDPTAVGYLNLHKRHPDAAEGPVEFNTGYTTSEALKRLSQLQDFLASFARLTERVRGRLTAADLTAAGNTEPEIQTIGFHNIPLVVEGALLKQDYQLKQAEYALARLKYARKEISAADLDRARSAYAEATKRFQAFWDKKLPTD